MDIKRPPLKVQQFRISMRTGADPTGEFHYKNLVINSAWTIVEVTIPGPTASFEVTAVGQIEKVRFQPSHYSGQIARLVIGPNQFPRINDAGTIHVSSSIQSPTAPGLQTYDPFYSFPVEMDLPPDYKYFTPYAYAQAGSGTGLVPYLKALGTPFYYDITFFGR